MYFKKHFIFKNWFGYFYSLYHFQDEQHSALETVEFDKYKMSNKWLKNGKIDDDFFVFNGENFLLRNDLFTLVFHNVSRHFSGLDSVEELSILLDSLVNASENLKYPFSFQEKIKVKLKELFSSCNTEEFLTVLLIFAQTGRICFPPKEDSRKGMVEVYNKPVINEHFKELVEDAIELDMMQAFVPSLIEKYTDFYKSENYAALIQLLKQNCKVNFIFPDKNGQFHEQNYLYSHKNDFFLFGDALKDSTELVLNLKKKFPGQVRIKIIPYFISYSLMIIKKRTAPAIVKVDLYLLKGDADRRHSFIFRSNIHREEYLLYRDNFFDLFNSPESKEI